MVLGKSPISFRPAVLWELGPRRWDDKNRLYPQCAPFLQLLGKRDFHWNSE